MKYIRCGIRTPWWPLGLRPDSRTFPSPSPRATSSRARRRGRGRKVHGGNRPAIVNISSIAGKRGIPARSHYSSSKFAVQGFSEAIRAELAKDGIDVLVVSPGLTQTNFSKNMLEQKAKLQLDHLRGMTSEDVARATLRAIARGTNETTLTFKGKLLVLVARFFPWIVDLLTKADGVKVVTLFSPEHGLYGKLDEKVGHGTDPKTGLKVWSLYGETRKPTAEMLVGVDTPVWVCLKLPLVVT